MSVGSSGDIETRDLFAAVAGPRPHRALPSRPRLAGRPLLALDTLDGWEVAVPTRRIPCSARPSSTHSFGLSRAKLCDGPAAARRPVPRCRPSELPSQPFALASPIPVAPTRVGVYFGRRSTVPGRAHRRSTSSSQAPLPGPRSAGSPVAINTTCWVSSDRRDRRHRVPLVVDRCAWRPTRFASTSAVGRRRRCLRDGIAGPPPSSSSPEQRSGP